ncbi:MAG: methyltransferase domain-containing protein [Isosphaeraceae bacterium]
MTLPVPLDLSHRCRLPEIMDQPGLDPAEHVAALRGLGRINTISRTASAVWNAIEPLAREAAARGETLRVLDVATGGGDVPIRLARRAAHAGLALEVAGCDRSEEALRFAAENAHASRVSARFFTHDALAGPLPEGFDVVTCTLFLHHLDENEATTVLARMAAAAARLVVADDLIRNRLGHLLAWVGCHVLSTSRVVHYDGPLSVRSAFTLDEIERVASRAGLEGATLTRHWPQRFLLCWRRR